MTEPRLSSGASQAEYRQALCLSAFDALSNTPEPTAKALAALKVLMHRLAQSDPFTTKEEGDWLSFLQYAGWELVAPFDLEKWKALTDLA